MHLLPLKKRVMRWSNFWNNQKEIWANLTWSSSKIPSQTTWLSFVIWCPQMWSQSQDTTLTSTRSSIEKSGSKKWLMTSANNCIQSRVKLRGPISHSCSSWTYCSSACTSWSKFLKISRNRRPITKRILTLQFYLMKCNVCRWKELYLVRWNSSKQCVKELKVVLLNCSIWWNCGRWETQIILLKMRWLRLNTKKIHTIDGIWLMALASLHSSCWSNAL